MYFLVAVLWQDKQENNEHYFPSLYKDSTVQINEKNGFSLSITVVIFCTTLAAYTTDRIGDWSIRGEHSASKAS